MSSVPLQQQQFVQQPVIHTHGVPSSTIGSTGNDQQTLLGQQQFVGSSNLASSQQPVQLMQREAPIGASNYYIGQDFYTPSLGLKGLKISPARRTLLDTISNKKWSKLNKVKSDDLRDRSAPNFAIRENTVIPAHSPLYKQFLDQINNKKWNKLVSPKKDVMHDRSSPNLALWRAEGLSMDQDYEKRYEKSIGKDVYRNDFFWPMPEKVMTPSKSASKSYKSGRKSPAHSSYSSSSTTSSVPLGHHSDLNSAFPVMPGAVRQHQDVSGVPAFHGATIGEKFSNLGKEFVGWVKEEISEVGQGVRTGNIGHGVRNQGDYSTLAPGSAVNSGNYVNNNPAGVGNYGSNYGTRTGAPLVGNTAPVSQTTALNSSTSTLASDKYATTGSNTLPSSSSISDAAKMKGASESKTY